MKKYRYSLAALLCMLVAGLFALQNTYFQETDSAINPANEKPTYTFIPGRLIVHMPGSLPTAKQLEDGEMGIDWIDNITEHKYGVKHVYAPSEFDDIYELVFDNPNTDIQKVIAELNQQSNDDFDFSMKVHLQNYFNHDYNCEECFQLYSLKELLDGRCDLYARQTLEHEIADSYNGFYAVPNLIIKLDGAETDIKVGDYYYTQLRGMGYSMLDLIPPFIKKTPSLIQDETDLSKLVADYLENGRRINDPLYKDQHHFPLIDAQNAWNSYGDTNTKVLLYIIDQGMDYKHKDLNANMLMWQDSYGYDFVNNRKDPKNRIDAEFHGTHVGGIAASVMNNGEGGTGFSNNIQVRSFRVLSEAGSGSLLDIARGIKAAADEAVKINSLRPKHLQTKIPGVINMSLGASGRLPRSFLYPLEEACNYAYSKGLFIVAAAGNEGNEEGTRGNGAGYPARYDNVLGVGASAHYFKKEGRAFFSNHGKGVDLCAPGAGITKAVRGDGILSTMPGDKYGRCCGTSMASPVAAGLACYLITLNKDISLQELRRIMVQTGDDIKSDKPIGRRINAFKAAQQVRKSCEDQHGRQIVDSMNSMYRMMRGTGIRDPYAEKLPAVSSQRKKLVIGDGFSAYVDIIEQ